MSATTPAGQATPTPPPTPPARTTAPTIEPRATVGATATATASPTATPTPDPAERFADLRTPGGPAETLLPAGQQDQVDSPLHRRWWDSFGPASFTNPEWEWVNKAELWDAVVQRVWADAVERYGDRLYDRPGTVWPGSDTSAYALGAWSSHMESGGYGHVGLARVGLHPSDPQQRRPDLGVYWFQVAVDEVEPGRFTGELVMVSQPFEMSGELVFPDETRPFISEHGWPATPPLRLIEGQP